MTILDEIAPLVGATIIRRDAALAVGDAILALRQLPIGSVDLLATDPPYFLSNGGSTNRGGRRTSVDKGAWDASAGIERDHVFHHEWLEAAALALSPAGTIAVSATSHAAFSIGWAMQRIGFKLLNVIVWQKTNPPPNLARRTMTHAHELVLWAAPPGGKGHVYDPRVAREIGAGAPLHDVWMIPAPGPAEKRCGKHPTQKPLELLDRIVQLTTRPGDLVVDPFCGSSTTGVAAVRQGRRFLGIDNSPGYIEIARRRILAA